jgi:hypothetical protein
MRMEAVILHWFCSGSSRATDSCRTPAPHLAGPVSQTESGEGGIGKKKTRHVGRVFNGRSPILTLVGAVYSQ